METTTRLNWSAKTVARRMVTMLAVMAFAASAYAVPAPAQAQSYSTHAVVVCQSASWKGGPSWDYPTVRTLYYGDKIGIRNGVERTNGFYLAEDYGWTGDHYWGYIYYTCVGGWNSW
jgi:uncharacterized protein YraI